MYTPIQTCTGASAAASSFVPSFVEPADWRALVEELMASVAHLGWGNATHASSAQLYIWREEEEVPAEHPFTSHHL